MHTKHTHKVTAPLMMIHTNHQEPDKITGRIKRRKLNDVAAEMFDNIYQSTRMHPPGTTVVNRFTFDVYDDHIDQIVRELQKINNQAVPEWLRERMKVSMELHAQKTGRFILLVNTTA